MQTVKNYNTGEVSEPGQQIMGLYSSLISPFIFFAISFLVSMALTLSIDHGIIKFPSGDLPISLNLVLTHFCLISTTAIILFISGYFKSGLGSVKRIMRLDKFKIFHLLIGFISGIVLLSSIISVDILLSQFFDPLESDPVETTNRVLNAQGTLNVFLTAVSVSFLGPIFEEFFARGAVMGLIENSKPGEKSFRIFAVIFSSFVFSILHFQGLSDANDLKTLLVPLVSGVIFSLLAIRFDSIYPAMSAHMSYNGAILLMGYL